jgi:hypothetical protein
LTALACPVALPLQATLEFSTLLNSDEKQTVCFIGDVHAALWRRPAPELSSLPGSQVGSMKGVPFGHDVLLPAKHCV